MAKAHLVILGEGNQPIRFTPEVRVAEMTFQFSDFAQHSVDSGDFIIASGAAVLDPLDTTTDATSGQGQVDARFVNVASTTDVTASHRYVIAHADDGAEETFTVAGFSADNYILAEAPLIRQYPTGSTVQGITFEAEFPSSVADDENKLQENAPYRVVWDYDIAGRAVLVQELIRHVRHNNSDMSTDAVIEMIQSAWPDYATRMDTNYKLENAVEFSLSEIRSDLLRSGIKPEEYLLGTNGNQLLFWRTMKHLAMLGNTPGNRPPDEFFEMVKGRYQDIWLDVTMGNIGAETSEIEVDHDKGTREGAATYRSLIGRL